MFTEFLKHLDRLMVQRPHSKEALASYRDLVSLMTDMEPKPETLVIEDRLKATKREHGFPLFSRNDLPLDFEATSMLLSRLLEYLKEAEREDKEAIRKAALKSKEEAGWAVKCQKAVLDGDEEGMERLASEIELNPRVLVFITSMALKPALYALRWSWSEKIEKKGWDYGYCPLCGSEPNMAYLDKNGKRFLHCGLCGEEWSYPRLKCPFCQNEDQKRLGYFESDQEEGFRVDFCRACKRYIKTVDQRVFEEPAPMELEFIATLHLDVLASEQGLK